PVRPGAAVQAGDAPEPDLPPGGPGRGGRAAGGVPPVPEPARRRGARGALPGGPGGAAGRGPGGPPLVLAGPQSFLAAIPTVGWLGGRLSGRGLGLAYDDFGVGQSRLAALAQVPPDYVKLDQTLVQGLPHSRPLRELVRALGQVCAEVGSRLIAKGVQTEEEAAHALELGCRLGQGFLFGRPAPAA